VRFAHCGVWEAGFIGRFSCDLAGNAASKTRYASAIGVALVFLPNTLGWLETV